MPDMRKVRENLEIVEVEHRFHYSLRIRKSRVRKESKNLKWKVRGFWIETTHSRLCNRCKVVRRLKTVCWLGTKDMKV